MRRSQKIQFETSDTYNKRIEDVTTRKLHGALSLSDMLAFVPFRGAPADEMLRQSYNADTRTLAVGNTLPVEYAVL